MHASTGMDQPSTEYESPISRYTCTECNRKRCACMRSYRSHTDTFARLPTYRQHVTRGCTGTPPRRHAYVNKCRMCGAQFVGEPNIVGHFKEEHVDEKPFECDKCEHQFWSSLGRLYHSRKCTGRPPTAPCFVAKASECRVCSATFRSHTLLRNHFLHEHNSNRPFMCGKCGSTWRFESVAQKHETRCTGRLRTLHRLKPRPCRLCGEVLVSGAKTMEHFKRLHADSRPFMCGSCGELFYWNVSRRNHERTCDGTLRRSDTSCVQPKAGVCRLCNKPMGSITLHQLHFRVVHPDNKPFACARACGSTLSAPVLLCHLRTGHEFVHEPFARLHERKCTGTPFVKSTNIGPKTCAVCNEQLPSGRQLRAHTRVAHANARPFGCDKCKQTFVSDRSRDRHHMDCTGQPRPRKCVFKSIISSCRLCTDTFDSQKQLLDHFRTAHVNDRPFKCSVRDCAYTFNYISNQRQHEQRCTGAGHRSKRRCRKRTRIDQQMKHDTVPGVDAIKDEPVNNSDGDDAHEQSYVLSIRDELHRNLSSVHRQLATIKYECNDCGETGFESAHAYAVHCVQVHQRTRPFKCITCHMSYAQRTTLFGHAIRCRLQLPIVRTAPTSLCLQYNCGAAFYTDEELMHHLRSIHLPSTTDELLAIVYGKVDKISDFDML